MKTRAVISHDHPKYKARRDAMKGDRYNGAYYYSKEIVEKIIPLVDTDRNWVTINIPGECKDHSIVFIHNNLTPQIYEWLSEYKDLVLVCGIPETCEKVAQWGTPIYLPLSIDTEEVKKYRRPKTRRRAIVGRSNKCLGSHVLPGTDRIFDMPRSDMLSLMAEYREVYAVGRCALEALVLGCSLLPYDERFPDVSRWKVVDSREAAQWLQKELDRIDKGGELNGE